MKRNIIAAPIGIFLIGITTVAVGGDLNKDATISLVSNSRNGGDSPFSVNLSGGTGPCYTIGFYPSDFADLGAFNRAWTQVLVAMSTGLRVRIANPSIPAPNPANGDCWHATYIETYL